MQSCLGLIKSSLDYCSKDIYETIIEPNDGLSFDERAKLKMYFPYGIKENGFKSMIGSSLKNLNKLNLNIYNHLESIQPYKSKNFWLINICTEINNIKHDNPGQIREDKSELIIEGIFKIDETSSIKFIGNSTINEKKMPENLVIDVNTPIVILNENNIDFVKIEWTKFKFEKTGIGVIELLDDSINGISNFYIRLYELLENNAA